MLAQRLRRWPNIETTLGQFIVFVGNVHLKTPHPQCRLNDGPVSWMVGQHYANTAPAPRIYRLNQCYYLL